tara:strand:+ start:2065 stop:3180 length:1116 start_codon:yes stop_codon:yes gene_type:complete
LNKFFSYILLLFLFSCNSEFDANDFAKNSLIVDAHINIPYKLTSQLVDNNLYENIAKDTSLNFDYPKALAGGLNIPFFAIYLPSETENNKTSFKLANNLIDMVEKIVNESPNEFFILKDHVYVGNLPGQNLIGIALGMENGAAIEGKLERVKYFYDRGIRYITLTHLKSNHISDSSYDSNKKWGGLSPFGLELIKEMNDIGMMINISHVSDEAFLQALQFSKSPVIASHSFLRHFTPGWERNVSDEMIIQLAKNRGVININFGSSFLISNNISTELTKNDYLFATVEDVVDHIDRVVELVGINHIGIGSDFDSFGDSFPIGLKDVSNFPNLINEMHKRGYSVSDIRKVLGENIIRVWREVDEYAKNNRSSN